MTRKQGDDFVINSAEDWGQLQETLYVLQNASLMRQIKPSAASHHKGKGYCPTQEQRNEINRFWLSDFFRRQRGIACQLLPAFRQNAV